MANLLSTNVSGRLYVSSQSDVNPTGGAFRFYDGSTFRGGLGLDDWAHAGSAANITMYVNGDNNFFISTSGVKRAQFNSGAAIFRTYSPDTNYNIRVTGGDQFNAYYGDNATTMYVNWNGGTTRFGGEGRFNSSLYSSGYVWAENANIRIGEIWGYGGVYRSEGSMIFGVEGGAGWSFRAGNSEKVWIGNDGNIYMAWAGAYISTLLDAKQNASTAITTSNIGSQSVNYSNYAGYSIYAQRIDAPSQNSFTVGGDPNQFYPVVFAVAGGATHNQIGTFVIERGGYEEPGYGNFGFTTMHLQMTMKPSGWGYGADFVNIDSYRRTQNMVASMATIYQSSRLILWLRGGTLYRWFNVRGATSLVFGNPEGTNYAEANLPYYDLNFEPTGTVDSKFIEYVALEHGSKWFGANLYVNNNITASNAIYAPIFYDSQDTGYYLDPNGESKLRKIWINNGGASGVGWSTGLNMGDGSNYWNLIQDAGTARQRNFGTGGYDWYNNTGGTQLMILSNAGNLSVAGTITSQGNSVITSGNIASQSVSYADESGFASSAGSVEWTSVQNKPATFPPSSHTHDDRYLPIGGGWYGVNLPGSRWGGYAVNGGEIVFGRDIPNTSQMSILVDGAYLAGENNGFWSLPSNNDWNGRRGMSWNGTYLDFTTNSPTAQFTSLRLANGFTISQGSSNYGVFNSWVNLSSTHGFYSSVNNAHLYPSDGTYGSWRIYGQRNGWGGLEFYDTSNGNISLMVNPNSNVTGFHNNSYGWQFRWEGGTLYCNKNSYGGGTQATVLDSSNFTSWAQEKENQRLSTENTPTFAGLNAFNGIVKLNEIRFTDRNGSTHSDPYTLRWIDESSARGNGLSWLEFQLNDDYNEEIRIYGNSCVGYGCGTYSENLYHRFRADGYAWHAGTLQADGDMRSQIFYASGDTNYFWQPNVNSAHRLRTANGYVDIGPMNSSWCHFQTDRANFYFGQTIYADASGFATYGGSTSMTKTDINSPIFLVPNHSDNTKGYRIYNTSNSSVSAMFVNSANALVIGAGAFDQVQLNKKTFINGASLGVNVAASATAGRIDASNDIVAYSSSDERLKENIAPIENALDKVKSLTGVEFDWKPEYKHAHGYEGHDTGIIAQQVEAVMPSAVRTNDTGFLAVRYEKLIGLLIEANKELAARVEELEKKLG